MAEVDEQINVENRQQQPGFEELLQSVNETNKHIQDISEILINSELFSRTSKDLGTQFWTVYERIAKEHDEEFLERHNTNLDSLLIFAGLFSAISTAFIVDMESSLTPDPMDTTNALLSMLVQNANSSSLPNQTITLPVWDGPSSLIIWTQSLAYASLATSLLAAFGAVLAKQWLAHFKSSRFGRGSLAERCQRRQQKFLGLTSWCLEPILESLPVLLQLSLLFFAISLTVNIWVLNHVLGAILIFATASGVIFYTTSLVIAVLSSHSPFESWASALLSPYFMSSITLLQNSKSRAPHVYHNTVEKISAWTLRKDTDGDIESHSLQQEQSYHDHEPITHLQITPVFNSLTEVQAIKWLLDTSTDADVLKWALRKVLTVEWPSSIHIETSELRKRLRHQWYAFRDGGFINQQTGLGSFDYFKAACHLDLYSRNDEDLLFDLYETWRIREDAEDIVRGDIQVSPDLLSEASNFLILWELSGEDTCVDLDQLFSYCHVEWISHFLPYYALSALHFKVDTELKGLPTYFMLVECCLLHEGSTVIHNALLSIALFLRVPVGRDYLGKLDKSSSTADTLSTVLSSLTKLQLTNHTVDQFLLLRHSKFCLILANFLSKHNELEPKVYGDNVFNALKQVLFYFGSSDFDQISRGVDPKNGARSTLRLAVSIRERPSYFVGPRSPFEGTPLQTPPQHLVDYIPHILSNPEDLQCVGWPLLMGSMDWSSIDVVSSSYIHLLIKLMESPVPRVRYIALWATSSLKDQLSSVQDTELRSVVSVALLVASQPKLQPTTLQDKEAEPPLGLEQSYDLLWRPNKLFGCNPILSYLELIETLNEIQDWRVNFLTDGHFQRLIDLVQTLTSKAIYVDFRFWSLPCASRIVKIMIQFLDNAGDLEVLSSSVERLQSPQQLAVTGYKAIGSFASKLLEIVPRHILRGLDVQSPTALCEDIPVLESKIQNELLLSSDGPSDLKSQFLQVLELCKQPE